MQIRSAIKHSIKPSMPEPAGPLSLYLISSFLAASMAYQSLHRLPALRPRSRVIFSKREQADRLLSKLPPPTTSSPSGFSEMGSPLQVFKERQIDSCFWVSRPKQVFLPGFTSHIVLGDDWLMRNRFG